MINPELYLKSIFHGYEITVKEIEPNLIKFNDILCSVFFNLDSKVEISIPEEIGSSEADMWCITVGIDPYFIKISDLKDLIIEKGRVKDKLYLLNLETFKGKAIIVEDLINDL